MSDHTPDPLQKQCSKCGEWKPATADYFSRQKGSLRATCKTCASVYMAAYYSANRDKTIKRGAARYIANKDKIKKLSAAYRLANKDKERARATAYRLANRDKTNAHNAAYRAANKDKIKERDAAYRAAYPEKLARHKHRRRARKHALPATFTNADWARCLEHFGCCCAYCGRPRGFWHTLSQDHYIPLSHGGAYVPTNIVPACHGEGGCNNSKLNRDAHEWLVWKFGARKAARIERRIREYFESVADKSQKAGEP